MLEICSHTYAVSNGPDKVCARRVHRVRIFRWRSSLSCCGRRPHMDSCVFHATISSESAEDYLGHHEGAGFHAIVGSAGSAGGRIMKKSLMQLLEGYPDLISSL